MCKTNEEASNFTVWGTIIIDSIWRCRNEQWHPSKEGYFKVNVDASSLSQGLAAGIVARNYLGEKVPFTPSDQLNISIYVGVSGVFPTSPLLSRSSSIDPVVILLEIAVNRVLYKIRMENNACCARAGEGG
ncbi:hypothetical protein TorRG33x02_004430 [Trema orientale]|uniref:Uncharacterized protein n=1 Tax=Trema orientale TaxID=63057 RepID=A0A2P5G296_TREOI|nr:hypothetical protein TorRG33x02_004430 [Trema orientale]